MSGFKHNWIYSGRVDTLFILLPPFVSLFIVMLLPDEFKYSNAMPVAAWVILVLLIDVAHVYSTIFRTYLDKEVFAQQKNLMLGIPLVCFVVAVLLYSYSDMLFWRLLAYLAVFHFIRQQYGFMRIYSRGETYHTSAIIDKVTIYTATVYPIIYWHLSGNRNFNWFIEGDFYYLQSVWLLTICSVLYYTIISVYVVKEVVMVFKSGLVNVPKVVVIAGTAISWYAGIVYFNGDLAFTLLNVVAHGIPYMALIWAWGRKKKAKLGFANNKVLTTIFTRAGIVAFVLIIVLLAYVEEGFWDALVWNDHVSVFAGFHAVMSRVGTELLKVVVPLLSLPQIVHYVIDGYIWKIKNDRFSWSKEALR